MAAKISRNFLATDINMDQDIQALWPTPFGSTFGHLL